MKIIARYLLVILLCLSTTPCFSAHLLQETKGKDSLVAMLTLVVVSLLKDEEDKIEIQARADDSIKKIQEKIKQRLEFSDKYHKLSFKEKTLRKDKLISDYDIGDKATVFIQKRSKGGSSFNIPSFGFSSLTHQKEINFSPTASAWRILCKGLNLEGICRNNGCKAHNKKVWVQKGFGTFSMQEEVCESICPICEKEVEEIKECAFFYCKYQIKGRKINNEKIDIKDAHNSKTGFRKFLAGGEKSATYKYLTIIVTEHQY